MRHKSAAMTIGLAVLAVFSALGLAQQSNTSEEKSGAGPMGRSMMSGGMMMGPMMTQHQEMSQLMNKMMESMAAIKSEKDPAKLKALIAEHSALLDQMRDKMMGQGKMMQNMAGQMKNCPMMGDNSKSPSK
jgi:hypothetical protein